MVAPTSDASRMWPRSPTRPSETSIAAVAMPRNARPRATRGEGRRSARSQSQDPHHRASTGPADAPAQAPHHRACPKPRSNRRPSRRCGAAPAARHFAEHRDAQIERAARRVAADEIDAVLIRERKKAARKAPQPVFIGAGSAPASSAQRGVAPIAAMSERLTASVLWPSASGSTSAKKWRPSTSMSTDTASSQPGDGASSAASSPTPSTACRAGTPEEPVDQLEFGHGAHAVSDR